MGCRRSGRWWWPMADLLAHLRRELEDFDCRAKTAREDGDDLFAVLLERDAAVVSARIATLEGADGNARSFPITGEAA